MWHCLNIFHLILLADLGHWLLSWNPLECWCHPIAVILGCIHPYWEPWFRWYVYSCACFPLVWWMRCNNLVWCGMLYFNLIYNGLRILVNLGIEQIRFGNLDNLDNSTMRLILRCGHIHHRGPHDKCLSPDDIFLSWLRIGLNLLVGSIWLVWMDWLVRYPKQAFGLDRWLVILACRKKEGCCCSTTGLYAMSRMHSWETLGGSCGTETS